jgi:anaerobic selenocysteine-containing dehydrogenase
MPEPLRRRVPAFPLCTSRWGCEAVVEDGRLVALEPDPSHPTGKALCAKGRASPELVEAPDRLLFPLRRTRPKGDLDPGWRRIGWDEALGETAAALRRIAGESGPEAVAFAVTTTSGTAISDAAPWINRLINAFGSPNNCNANEICSWHRDYARAFVTGTGIGTRAAGKPAESLAAARRGRLRTMCATSRPPPGPKRSGARPARRLHRDRARPHRSAIAVDRCSRR